MGHAFGVEHLGYADLEAGLDEVRRSPRDEGRVAMIVSRPAVDEREVLDAAELDVADGLVGDTWLARGSRHTDDGSAQPGRQITLMNSRAAELFARSSERTALAGDQLFVDLDLGYDNIPPGTRLVMGSAVLEITEDLHRGCAKFAGRFGKDALRLVNSEVGAQLNLRGVHAKVVANGTVHAGDVIRKANS
jgi:MOSC domain-containing protein YiiM